MVLKSPVILVEGYFLKTANETFVKLVLLVGLIEIPQSRELVDDDSGHDIDHDLHH